MEMETKNEKSEIKEKVDGFFDKYGDYLGVAACGLAILAGFSCAYKLGYGQGATTEMKNLLKKICPSKNTKYVVERFSDTSGKTYIGLFEEMTDKIGGLSKDLAAEKEVVGLLTKLKVDGKVDF